MKEVTFGHSKSYISIMRKLLNNIGPALGMERFLRTMLLSFILIFYFNCNAQISSIPDTSFRSFIKITHPWVLDASDSLIIDSANAVQGSLDCSHLNIKDLFGIQYFINVTSINCSNNQLTNIPSLAGYNDSLMAFDCSNNQLSALPFFRNGALKLRSVKCNGNLLYDLSNLGHPTFLDTLECENNYLDLTDLHYYATGSLSSFLFAPQFNSQVPVPPRVELHEGDAYTFPYPQHDTMSYIIGHRIFKNSIFLVNLQHVDTFKINSVKSSDAGFYSWQLTDSLLPGLIITTSPQELVIVNENSQIFTPDGDGKNDSYIISCDGNKGIYDKSGKLLKEFQGTTAYWDGTDLQGKPVPTGVYMIRCGEKVESSVTLIR